MTDVKVPGTEVPDEPIEVTEPPLPDNGDEDDPNVQEEDV